MDQWPKYRAENYKTLRRKHNSLQLLVWLWIWPQKREQQGKKPDILNFIKIKIFCASKDIIRDTKSQSTEWQKIFANHISDKDLTSKIYKELFYQPTLKTDYPIKKLVMVLNRHFYKEFIQTANNHMRRYSASLITRKCKLKPQRVTNPYSLGSVQDGYNQNSRK